MATPWVGEPQNGRESIIGKNEFSWTRLLLLIYMCEFYTIFFDSCEKLS
jgi:hypothetical protein